MTIYASDFRLWEFSFALSAAITTQGASIKLAPCFVNRLTDRLASLLVEAEMFCFTSYLILDSRCQGRTCLCRHYQHLLIFCFSEFRQGMTCEYPEMDLETTSLFLPRFSKIWRSGDASSNSSIIKEHASFFKPWQIQLGQRPITMLEHEKR